MQRRIEVIQLSSLRYRKQKPQGWLWQIIAGATLAVMIIQFLTA